MFTLKKFAAGFAAAMSALALATGVALAVPALPTIVGSDGMPNGGMPIAEQPGNRMHTGLMDVLHPWIPSPLPAYYNAATYGYVTEEYFISGSVATTGTDGVVTMTPYVTRILVNRPSDPAKSSGLVVLEGWHGDGLFQMWTHTRIGGMQAGHIYVGLNNTQASFGGTQGLRAFNAPRYSALNIGTANNTSAAVQNGIFAQVAFMLKTAFPSGTGFNARWIVMAGSTGSAGAARTFMSQPTGNANPDYRMPDGSPVADALYLTSTNQASEAELNGGLANVPVIIENSQHEWDVNVTITSAAGGAAAADRTAADGSSFYRLYMVAGAPHIDTRGPADVDPFSCMNPNMPNFMSSALRYMALDRIYDWLRDGVVPPSADRIAFNATGIVFDRFGNATGGVRSPQLDVPTYTYGTPNSGNQLCTFSGFATPLTAEQLNELYPGGKADYARQLLARTAELIAEGWFPAEYLFEITREIENFGRPFEFDAMVRP